MIIIVSNRQKELKFKESVSINIDVNFLSLIYFTLDMPRSLFASHPFWS